MKKHSKLNDEQQKNLLGYITNLPVGGRLKIAFKGNKEVRQICIRDSNKVVSLAVLKNPRITDGEISRYATLKSLAEDVVRVMANNVQWTKAYPVKLALCFHPKTPLQNSMQFIKFLNIRDLTKTAKERSIPSALQKAAKELLTIKRK